MTWCIDFTGRPEAVQSAILQHEMTLNGDSKDEFKDVVGPVISLVKLNTYEGCPQLLRVRGFGSSSKNGEKTIYRSCNLSIEIINSKLVT